ncbi:Lrp/AsnC ligand binding domain-containing protein [Kribbella kalugense]|uniref:AsnC-like helix-turn-helix protein n=1 Tax=Kribbella kalugense TaxID=2512221 RepID=A0A4R7Z9Y3_9ACTN|nr:Lrp/AsnC ligand binding domain-containing protein [Kribbella kalugense]TDW14229.1 AsnC-like helix-turn-helix protein [Kribbella kalugense]
MTADTPVTAFILITVPAKKSGDLVRILMDEFSEFVTEAAAVYGEADVIAKVEAPSVQKLHELVMESIQNLANVSVTRTFIIIPSLHKTK